VQKTAYFDANLKTFENTKSRLKSYQQNLKEWLSLLLFNDSLSKFFRLLSLLDEPFSQLFEQS
jgi:hypothetical protein